MHMLTVTVNFPSVFTECRSALKALNNMLLVQIYTIQQGAAASRTIIDHSVVFIGFVCIHKLFTVSSAYWFMVDLFHLSNTSLIFPISLLLSPEPVSDSRIASCLGYAHL